jgi:type IV pilus assembly protein PilB
MAISWEDAMRLVKNEAAEKTTSQPGDRRLGDILIEEGLITKEQLEEASQRQQGLREYKPIGQVLMEMDAVTPKQLNLILDRFEKRARLGDILVRSGAITQETLKIALKQQQEKGVRLGEALVELNFITEEVMRNTLCTQLNIPYVDLDNTSIDRSLSRLINKAYAKKRNIVPVAKLGNTITLAMDDPTDTNLIEELQSFTGFSINVVTSRRSAILDAFNRLYEQPAEADIPSGLQLIEEEHAEARGAPEYLESQQIKKADAMVSQIISMGLTHSASDIHVETTDRRLHIRFRIDGVLQELPLGPLQEQLSKLRREVVSRIKILGKLDIAERRRPQDGSFRARIARDGQAINIDFRVSIVPGYYGENVVLRILDARNAPKSIDDLGFSKRISQGLHKLLRRTTGILLVTGPTGSGKSTTLYGALGSSYRPGIKILTAEDPIEYVYDNITQCEVNRAIGNTFAGFVRAFLRQDPEIIMVGEIRDAETAEMAIRAAQTGHMVLSTLHTNDAVSAVTRLLGLGVDPGLIASCLSGVLAQRLVRQVCPQCKKEYIPSEELMREFFQVPPTDIRWVAGERCSLCNHTGYKGRIAISELWIPSERDAVLINKGATMEDLRKSSYESSVLMAEDALEKLRAEKTNLDELIRMLPFSSIYEFRRLTQKVQRSKS